MCCSRCLKDTCSLMALDWSLIGSCVIRWIFTPVVGFLWNLEGFMECCLRWGLEGTYDSLKYVFNGI